MKDMIIVGSGIAACSLAWQLHKQGKTFVIITDRKKGSSAVAAGVYNPMVLKRFTAVWKAQEQLVFLNDLYDYTFKVLDKDFRIPISVARRFHDDKEARTWIKKSQRDDLKCFMNPEIKELNISGIDGFSGYGFVNDTGWVNTLAFMETTLDYFRDKNQVIIESFNYESLEIQNNQVIYKATEAKNIVFAEGYRVQQNPFFNHLPIQGNKGEVLIVQIPELELSHIIKSSVFLMPYKDDLFWVGATYDREDLEDTPTQDGKEFLISRLERFLKLPYKIIDHKHGIRPTTIDRRPFVGRHRDYNNMWVFNGMGSRAVLIAPWAAQQLIEFIFDSQPLNPEIDIKRFDKD